MSAPGNESEIDQQLRDLQEKAGELIPQCRFASSSRLYGELRRRGRTEHRAQAYVMGIFPDGSGSIPARLPNYARTGRGAHRDAGR